MLFDPSPAADGAGSEAQPCPDGAEASSGVRPAMGSLSVFTCRASDGERPLRGLFVTAVPAGAQAPVHYGMTDNRGLITFPEVAAGDYAVTAYGPGYVAQSATGTVVSGLDNASVLALSNSNPKRSRIVSGTVRDTDGKPLPGTLVFLRTRQGEGNPSMVMLTSSSGAGSFLFAGVPRTHEEVLISASRQGFDPFVARVRMSDAAAAFCMNLRRSAEPDPVDASTARGLTLRLQSDGAIELRFPAGRMPGRLQLLDLQGNEVRGWDVQSGATRLDLGRPAWTQLAGRFLHLRQGRSNFTLSMPAF